MVNPLPWFLMWYKLNIAVDILHIGCLLTNGIKTVHWLHHKFDNKLPLECNVQRADMHKRKPKHAHSDNSYKNIRTAVGCHGDFALVDKNAAQSALGNQCTIDVAFLDQWTSSTLINVSVLVFSKLSPVFLICTISVYESDRVSERLIHSFILWIKCEFFGTTPKIFWLG